MEKQRYWVIVDSHTGQRVRRLLKDDVQWTATAPLAVLFTSKEQAEQLLSDAQVWGLINRFASVEEFDPFSDIEMSEDGGGG